MIWGSDDTDPICRADIQTGYSYGYPPECVGAHVSASPNHQTLRRTPMRTQFAVAVFGSLGYECNLCDFSGEQMEEVKADIAFYKKYRSVLQHGRFYRSGTGNPAERTMASGNAVEWTVVAQDGRTAIGMMLKKLVVPNTQSVVNYCRVLLILMYECLQYGVIL